MDYIPAKIADKIAWLVNCSAVLTAAPANYGLTAPEALVIDGLVDAAVAAYNISTNPALRTPVSVQTTETTTAAAVAACRSAAVTAQALPSTSPQLVAAGFTVRSTTRTPQAPVTETCDIELVSIIPNEIILQARNPATPTSKKKPKGTGSVQFAMAIGTAVAVDPASATEYRFSQRNPARIQTDPSQRGKVLTVWARYQSKSGIGGLKVYGPFGVSLSVNLP